MKLISYRLLRRKLSSLAPTTMLGRLAAYMGGIWMGLRLARLSIIFFKPGSDALSGWTGAFDVIFAAFATLLFIRWVRQRLLWRVRNRLIVTYIFIGVIPVVLILFMVGICGYLISNQYATSQARSELNAEIRALKLVTDNHAQRLAGSADISNNDLRFLSQKFSGLKVSAWRDGKQIAVGDSEAGLKPPEWIKNEFRGVVVDEGKFFIRTFATEKIARHTATLLMSVPVTKDLLDRVVVDLGEVRFHIAVRADRESSNPRGVTVTSSDKTSGQNGNFTFQNSPVVAGGILPQRSASYWDPALNFWAYSPYREWATGKESVTSVVVTTRLSALIARLFENTGEYSYAAQVVLVIIACFLGIIEIIALFFGVGLTRTITLSVANLYRATQHINQGDLKYRITVKSKDQLASLQTAFNSMTESLERLLAEQKEKERLENELVIAQEVQETLFPRQTVENKSLEVHGVCRPARTVSGDYYDFLPCSDEQLGIALGDISGKGISAALLMASVHSAVRAYEYGRAPRNHQLEFAGACMKDDGGIAVAAQGMQSPAVVMEMLNTHLFQSTQSEKYATLFLSVYDGQKRSMTYCNAGHLPPIIVQDSGDVLRLDCGGMVIGLFDGMTYDQDTVSLGHNDIFVAFSDGITEPENEFGEFGEDRLIEIVRANRRLPLAKISELVIAAVQDWIGYAEQPDDITLVLAKVR